MGLDRRTFLQQAGLAWFTWEATDAGIVSLVNNSRLFALAKNYQQNLQPTNRKLALLVGINRYPYDDNLSGCLTDIELQRELLIHRFGFNPSDIVTISDRQATRENIETAFVEHLIQQASPDDAVVFHFSGYGRQIKMPRSPEGIEAADLDRSSAFSLVNSLVPIDGTPAKKASDANNILQDTLLVLAQSLSTTKCTFILDTSFNSSPSSKHGSFKVRSVSDFASSNSSSEQAFLTNLRQDFADKGLKPSKRPLSLPGVVLYATGKNQIAVERQWDGLSAGLFTYALTQHLWQTTPSIKIQVALGRTAETVERAMGRLQQPTLNNFNKSAIAYYFATDDASNATGVISKTSNSGKDIEVKLLGLPVDILDNYGVNSCFSLVSDPEMTPGLQIESRNGLIAKTQLLLDGVAQTPQIGDKVRESIRMLDRDRSLTLALDADLGRIERVDATSAMSNIRAIDSVVVAGEHNADCLLGKVTKNLSSQPETSNSDPKKPTFSYGLYTAGGNLIAKTTGVEEEAVKMALERLQPHFNSLLAAKWLELTCNEFSSRLKASATLIDNNEKRSNSWYRRTTMSDKQLEKKSRSSNAASGLDSGNNIPTLSKNSEIKLALNNEEERQLYSIILGVDSDCNIFALYTPANSTEPDVQLKDIAIASRSELEIPSAESSWKWKVPESVGINSLYVIFAERPFEKTLKAFANQQNYKLNQEQVLNVTNPIDVVNALLQDLHQASSVPKELLPSHDVYALDVASWATLNFVYEVIS